MCIWPAWHRTTRHMMMTMALVHSSLHDPDHNVCDRSALDRLHHNTLQPRLSLWHSGQKCISNFKVCQVEARSDCKRYIMTDSTASACGTDQSSKFETQGRDNAASQGRTRASSELCLLGLPTEITSMILAMISNNDLVQVSTAAI